VLAQLRYVFPTKNSTVMTEKDEDGGALRPQRSKADAGTVRIGKGDPGKSAAKGFRHEGHSPGRFDRVSSCRSYGMDCFVLYIKETEPAAQRR
jgi:hypothetical protein